MGIYSVNGDLVFEGDGSLTASGGTSKGSSYGIAVTGPSSRGSITINSGSITAIGGTSTSFDSAGVYTTCDGLSINGGSLTAIGGTGATQSFGAYIYDGTLNINGGTLNASSGVTQNISSLAVADVGISVYGNISLGPNVTITTPSNGSIGEIATRYINIKTIFTPSNVSAKEVIIQKIGK